ncbi:MAG: methyltransferase domain-containing protein [Thiobacillaceae bacterium]
MAAIEADITWAGGGAVHRDRLVMPQAALQADGALIRALADHDATGEAEIDPGRWITPTGVEIRTLPASAFSLRVQPVVGRFYPRLAYAGLAEGSRDLRPARLLAMDGDALRVDPNHPLAGREVRLTLRRVAADAARTRFVQLFDGPGMQVPPAHAAACYLPEGALGRQDETKDDDFYARARLVHHLDAACRAEIVRLHGRLLRPGMRVLDLMSSWVSHLPDAPADLHVSGLGMNAEELAANTRLAGRVVHDLNADPRLPYADAAFDLVLCTASVEYLIHPQAVFAEVRRVLTPGGYFVLSFSDRWFPPKAISVWLELHPYERLGMVLWLLREAGFADLHTETLRGLKRPEDDPHIGERDYSDPLFAAWGVA